MGRGVALILLAVGSLWAATYEDFLVFVKRDSPISCDESLWSELYNTFLKDLTPQDSPVFFAIGGGPASGKSTLRRHFATQLPAMYLHDMDEVVIRMEEYKKDWVSLGPQAAFENHFRAARSIADTMTHFAFAHRYSILYDRTCAAEESYRDILRAKQLGYQVSLIGVYVDQETALQRAKVRGEREGRCLPPLLIKEWRARFSAIWPYYLDLIEDVSLYDTKEESPRLIYSSAKKIQDASLYRQFLDEGEPFRDFFSRSLP